MKKLATVIAFVLSLSVLAMAEDFSGYIADQNCANKMGAKSASDAHAKCAEKCIQGGAAAVLVTPEGKVYKLSDQDQAKEHAGHKVTVAGKLEGDTIQVDSIKM
jgi:hypothetical protein